MQGPEGRLDTSKAQEVTNLRQFWNVDGYPS